MGLALMRTSRLAADAVMLMLMYRIDPRFTRFYFYTIKTLLDILNAKHYTCRTSKPVALNYLFLRLNYDY